MSEPTVNPLLAIKLPGQSFQLPSKGKVYADGVLSDKAKIDGTIHVHPMSAISELSLKNTHKLFSGEAFSDVCREFIPDILKPDQMCSKDVDAVFAFLRITSYGRDFDITASHDCEATLEDGSKAVGVEHLYRIDVQDFVNNMQFINEEHFESIFKMKIGKDFSIILRPTPIFNANTFNMLFEAKLISGTMSEEDKIEMIILSAKGVIASVNGITDEVLIEQWLRSIPTQMLYDISMNVASVNDFGIKNEATLKCKDCGQPFKVLIPLNPMTFFTS